VHIPLPRPIAAPSRPPHTASCQPVSESVDSG
jgi:hypothetical protein